jgi:hypothetical protein
MPKLVVRSFTLSLDGSFLSNAIYPMPSFTPFNFLPMNQTIRTYYVLPCCLLLLNLLNTVISYKARMIDDGILRTFCVIGMILFGGAAVAFLVSPGIEALVRSAHQASRRRAGFAGELIFLAVLGLAVFWLYFRANTLGTASILPPAWRNPRY